ncbi:MAG: hypothetical protein ACERKK_12745 [Poseidonibacter sp.]|uniref:hypothetical protein n=1 Tax=Poseidonibacter sp. TaxID=2321188 RepID=UPI00359E1695
MNTQNPKLERIFEKPIKIFGKQLKIMRVILIFIASILYTGMLYVEINSTISLVFSMIFTIFLIMSIILMKKRILYLGKYNLECSVAGDVYLTQLQGICPKCKGFLKISKKDGVKIIQCQTQNDHIWNLEEKIDS